MYKKVIVITASVLFSLLTLLAIIIMDLHDRDFPQDLDVESKVTLDFTNSPLTIDESFELLEKENKRLALGLLKVVPNLEDKTQGKLFVDLSEDIKEQEFTWFNHERGVIVGKERLAHSYPDGEYYIRHANKNEQFKETLHKNGVEVVLREPSIFYTLLFVLFESGFTIAIIASIILMTTLSLLWLAIKAKGRALRVLNGVPTSRIQIQDLSGFIALLLLASSIILIGSILYIGIFHQWMYLGIFLVISLALQLIVLVTTVLFTIIMSLLTWPKAWMLATRQPAIKNLRLVTTALQLLTFILVVILANAAWHAYQNSKQVALEMQQWNQLSDQVALEFATDLDGMRLVESHIENVIREMEEDHHVLLSYTLSKDMGFAEDFGEYEYVSFVNQGWLDTIGVEENQLTEINKEALSHTIVKSIDENLEIWFKEGNQANMSQEITFMTPSNEQAIAVSVGGGGEQLVFTDNVLLVILPSISTLYSESSLTSMVSGKNITFTGAIATQRELQNQNLDAKGLRQAGVTGEINVVYIAENGMLQAQYAAYMAWLRNLSLISILLSFTIVTAMNAFITALIHAKKNFILRLSGERWLYICKDKLMREFLVGAIIIVITLAVYPNRSVPVVLLIAFYGIVVTLLSHFVSIKWCFNQVKERKL